VLLICGTATASVATKALFLTGGQSNTDGRLYAETLPSYLQSANSYCLASCHAAYSADRLGKFYAYHPTSGGTGQPSRWAYDAVTYYYIGQALGETFYVAKTSYGGTSIDPSISNSPSGHDNAWLPQYGGGYHWSADPTFLSATTIAGTTFEQGGTTYDGQSMLLAWMANVDAAIDAIKAQGDTPDVKAIIWHQGESDKNASGSYYSNLKAMVKYVRDHLVEKTGESKYATLPFFCGTIPHASSLVNSTVEKAFFALEDEDANFHVIDLRDLTMLGDAKHFDAPSAELFGKRLYNRMVDESVISGSRLDDVAYAEVDYSDFGSDEYVGETTTWAFDNQSGSFYSGTQIVDHMYLHGGGSTQRRFEYVTGQSAQTLTYPDGYEQTATSYVRSNLGSNTTESSISDSWNASHSAGNCIGLNVLYPGTFTLNVAIETVDKSVKLFFNGKNVATATCETANAIQQISYTATAAGTYYIYCNDKYKLWGARFVPTTDRTGQRTVTTDADGYAAFGNITGANLGLPAGLTAWAVAPSATDAQVVEMAELSGIDKGTGALLKGTANTEYVLPFAWTAANYEGENDMTAQQATGDVEETSGGDFINYTFANRQFTRVSGSVSVVAGSAYLSISNGAAQCANSTLTPEIPAVPYAYVDSYSLFGNDEAVTQATTWLTGNMTTPGSDGTVQQLGGLYGRGQSGSNNRSFFKTTGKGSATFSDGTTASWSSYLYINNDYSGGWSLSASTTANNTTCGDYLAANIAVPGTFYVLFSSKDASSERTLDLYYEGTKAASATSTGSDDIKEIKYTVAAAGTVLLDCRLTCRVYALRFVPTDNRGIYTKVLPIGWGSMSLPYPAIVPDGTCVYYVSGYEDGDETGTLTLTTVAAGGIIPAKQGFLFNGVKGLYRFEKSMTAATWTDNMLVGTADGALTGYDSSAAADPVYVLATIDSNTAGFKKFTGTSIAQYKAYLQLGTAPTAKAFRFVTSDSTPVQAVHAADGDSITAIYTLGGTQVSALQRGVNIVKYSDGTTRKIMVK